MPVLFIVLGTFLICILFNFITLKSRVDKCVFLAVLPMIMSGYFMSDFFIQNVSINVLFFVSLLILGFYFFIRVRVFVWDIILFLVVGVLYYYLLNHNLSFLIGYSSDINLVTVFVLVLFYSLNFYKSALMSLVLSLILVAISGVYTFDNFGVYEFDLLFCFDVMFYSCLLSALRLLLNKLLIEETFRRRYVKKGCFVYCSYSYRYCFLR